MNLETMDKHESVKQFLRSFITGKWFFIFIFFIALMARVFAANRIGITNVEAKNLLFLTGSFETYSSTFSPIHLFYFRVTDFLFGKNLLVFRLLSVISGSLFVLLPYLYKKHIRQKEAFWLALFLLMDPILNANSVLAVGYSLTILLSGLLVFFLIEGKTKPVIILAIVIFLSGPGTIFLMIGILLLIGTFWLFKKSEYRKALLLVKDRLFIQSIDESKTAAIILVGIAILFLIKPAGKYFSLGFQSFFNYLAGPYKFGNYPIVYPFLLVGYFPLLLSATLLFSNNTVKRIKKDFPYWISFLLFLLFIVFYPGHQYLDLIWISIPLACISARSLGDRDINISINQKLVILVFCMGIISQMIHLQLSKILESYERAFQKILIIYCRGQTIQGNGLRI